MIFVSYNVQWGTGKDGRVDLSRLAGEIGAADVSALQAVDRPWTRAPMAEQAAGVPGLALGGQGLDAPVVAIGLVVLLAFALDWAAFPLAVLALAPSMDFEDHVLRYIPALNWARVLELVVLLPAAAIGGAEPGGLGVLFRLAQMISVLVYHWFVAKSALEVTGPQAALLVGPNLVLGFIISLLALSLDR